MKKFISKITSKI